jgi:hypothetical protein
LVSLSTEEQLAVLASALRRLEGRASTSAILFARERYENETLRTN